MRNYLTMLILVAVIVAGGYAFAEHHEPAAPEAEAKNDMGGIKEAGNKICPVDGEKIGSMGEAFKIEHDGTIYNLCCAACEMKFKEDPEKYVGIVKKELGREMRKEIKPVQLDEHGHDHSKDGGDDEHEGHEGHDDHESHDDHKDHGDHSSRK